MKHHALPRFKERNHLVLHPLMKKGGVHAEQDVDHARMRERRKTRQQLRKTAWLGHD